MDYVPTTWARAVSQEEEQSSPKKDKTQGKWNLHPIGICYFFWEKPFFSSHQASHKKLSPDLTLEKRTLSFSLYVT